MQTRFGRDESSGSRGSRAQMGSFTRAPTPLAGFERLGTSRGTRLPVTTTPAPRLQSTTAYGRSFALPPAAGNHAGPSLSRIAGRASAVQDPIEQRRKKEDDEERAFHRSMGL